MARGDQLGRQWRIIQTLISSKLGRSASDLAADLDCHPRTVYRDLEALQSAGFPIYTERVEGKNVWSVLDTVKHHIPVPFSITELMALHFSSGMLNVFNGTVFHDALKSLFKKVKATLPPGSVDFLEGMDRILHIGTTPRKDYVKFKEILNRISDAALERSTVEIIYYTMSRKRETRRKVDPYRILFFSGTFYLIGYCHVRKEIRVFAVDRIKMLSTTGEHFEIPDGFDPQEFMERSFGVYQGEPARVRIWFSDDVADYIREKIWHGDQKIIGNEDGSIIFETVVAGTEEIRFWVMMWGGNAEVLEPPSLREAVQKEAEAILGHYGRIRFEKTIGGS